MFKTKFNGTKGSFDSGFAGENNLTNKHEFSSDEEKFDTNIQESDNDFPSDFDEYKTLKGEDGISPDIEVEPTDVGYRVTMTDRDGTHIFELTNGISSNIEVFELENGYRVIITDENGKKYFDVFHGASSTIDVEYTEDGHIVTITDKNGTKTKAAFVRRIEIEQE